jgi:hypothetical protein
VKRKTTNLGQEIPATGTGNGLGGRTGSTSGVETGEGHGSTATSGVEKGDGSAATSGSERGDGSAATCGVNSDEATSGAGEETYKKRTYVFSEWLVTFRRVGVGEADMHCLPILIQARVMRMYRLSTWETI